MKYSIDTYGLYQSEKRFAHVARIHVRMKDEVDLAVLDQAVNTAMKRYPYFAVRVSLDEDGGYFLLPNDKRIVVMRTQKDLPKLGSKAVNEHLLYVDCEGKDIYLNIGHSLCGGKGFQPWVMTTIYEYVKEKYKIEPHAPGIFKPEDELLPGETTEPTMEMLSTEPPIYKKKVVKSPIFALDYLNGLFNPFMRKPTYWVFVIDQADLIKVAKQNDSSVVTLFFIIFARALERFFSKKYKTLVAEAAHNPRETMGLPNSHSDLLTHVQVKFDRDQLDKDLDTLGTMARGQVILQTDPSISHAELRKYFSLYEAVDKVHGVKNKMKYFSKHSPSVGKDAQHGTFICNYTGWADWGDVAGYVDWYTYVIEGHCTSEITALGDKLVLGLMQLVNTKKYALAIQEELTKLGISCRLEGPYSKRLPRHELPE